MASKRYKLHKKLKPKRSLLKKILKNRFFWLGALGCLVFGGVVYGVFFTPFLQIQHIEIQGNQKISAERIRELAQEHLVKKFWFFEINNLFLADANSAAENIQTAFPEMEAVVVDKAFPNKITVIVKERSAVAVWCQDSECFALDRNGIIFPAESPEGIQAGPPQSEGLGGEVIIYGKKENVVLGEQAIDPQLLEKILGFQKQLDSSVVFKEGGLRISVLSVISKERVNAKISDLSGQEEWEMYVNPTENIDWQATKAKLVLEEEIPAAKRPNLEYIDLRFGDQAYIRYK